MNYSQSNSRPLSISNNNNPMDAIVLCLYHGTVIGHWKQRAFIRECSKSMTLGLISMEKNLDLDAWMDPSW